MRGTNERRKTDIQYSAFGTLDDKSVTLEEPHGDFYKAGSGADSYNNLLSPCFDLWNEGLTVQTLCVRVNSHLKYNPYID